MTRDEFKKFLTTLEDFILYGDIHEEPVPTEWVTAYQTDDIEAYTRIQIAARLHRLVEEIDKDFDNDGQVTLTVGALKRAIITRFDISKEK